MLVIETDNLTKYYGDARGIIDVNLAVEPGEIFGFIGPNGAGKSTTIRLLLNFIQPTEGQARVFGLDSTSAAREIKERVGYLPTEVAYYGNLTAQQLLNYSASFYDGDYQDRILELADHFELDLTRRFDALSMGNKKKVAIIQSILHQPDLLILDEPTGGLDPLIKRRFFNLLRQLNDNGTTIFFSSHVLSEVQKLCERVGVIKEGRLVEVEEMGTLREMELKRVKIQFSPDEQQPQLDLPGIMESNQEGKVLDLTYNGPINRLTEALAQKNLANLWMEEPDLEEIFMHYYEREEE